MSETTRRFVLAGLIGVGLAALLRARKRERARELADSLQRTPEPPPALALDDRAVVPPTPAPRLEGTHDNPLVSWALSPDGAALATGAEAGPDQADDPVEGVVLWDLASAAPTRRIRAPGGVGLCDQLREAIRFSDDGKIIAFNAHTNGVFVANAATGEILVELYLTEADGPPQHALSGDGEWIFVEQFGSASLGSVVPARHSAPPEAARRLPAQAGTLHALRLSADALLVVNDGVFRAISLDGSPRAEAAALLPGHRLARLRGALLAVAGEGVALMRMDRKESPVVFPKLTGVEGLALAGERAIAITQGPSTRAVALSPDGREAPIDRALTRIDWQGTPDFLPAAPSPDGREALLLGEDGAVERWSLDGTPAKTAVIERFEGLRGVLWPRPDRAVLVGPQLLVFLEMPSGKALRVVGFPARGA